jgi:hypothetical protein
LTTELGDAHEDVEQAAVQPVQLSLPSKSFRDVQRDISPDADNDDYGNLPAEERIAQHDDRAALERHRHDGAQEPVTREPVTETASQPSPRTVTVQGEWFRGAVSYLNVYRQCGRVHIPELGDMPFTDKTLALGSGD